MPPVTTAQRESSNSSTNHNVGNTIGLSSMAERESRDMKEQLSDSAWEDVETE